MGTHSAWVQEVIAGLGHEVLVANPRMMEGSKRRRRKNDRIDADKLARLGRVDPKSLYPIQHRSTEVREDLLVLRARDALVAVADGIDQHRACPGEDHGGETVQLFERGFREESGNGDSERATGNAAAVIAV